MSTVRKVLFLDDEEYRHSGADKFVHNVIQEDGPFEIVHAWTAKAAIGALIRNQFAAVFLDHDLGGGNGSGMDVVDFIVARTTPAWTGPIMIHSFNTYRALQMINVLTAGGFTSYLTQYRAGDDWPF